MKKTALCLMALGLSLTVHPLTSNATTTVANSYVTVSKTAEAAEAKILLTRLDEINAMDKSNLRSADKKELRTEVRAIRHRLSDIGGGVYLSVGAIIIILIVLIIIF